MDRARGGLALRTGFITLSVANDLDALAGYAGSDPSARRAAALGSGTGLIAASAAAAPLVIRYRPANPTA